MIEGDFVQAVVVGNFCCELTSICWMFGVSFVVGVFSVGMGANGGESSASSSS